MRKHLFVWMVIGLLVMAGTGIAAAKTTLTFWNGFTGPDRPVLEQLVAEFNEANPDIEIKMDIQPWDTLFQKLMPAYVVGKGPDIAAFATENIPQYASAGVLAPVDDIYGSGDGKLDPAVLVSAILDNVKYDGKSYAVPMNFATLLLYYNKDHFAEAGLPTEPPKTWEECREYILALTNPPERYGLAIAARETIPMWPILMWGNGGGILTKDGQVLIDSPETKDAIRFWTEVIRDQKACPIGLSGAEADKLFQTGKASMEMVGPWMTSGFTAAGLNYDVAPIPAGPERQVTLGTSVAMVLSKPAAADAQKKAAAYRFFEFWNSRESQVTWALGSGFPPSRTDLLDDPRIMQHPWVPKFAAAADYAHFYLQGTDKFRAIETDVLIPALESILLGKKDVDTALDDAGAQLRALIKE